MWAIIYVPTIIRQGICVFNASSVEELRTAIHSPSCERKLIYLDSNYYNGSFLIGNGMHDIIVMPNPKNRGCVIFDALGADYNIAIDNASNISIKRLILKNANNSIILENTSNIIISSNDLLGFKVNGISLSHCILNNSILSNNISSNNRSRRVGINVSNSRDILINDNNITGDSPTDNFIDILLNRSQGNTIDFLGSGFIIEDSIQCGVRCNGNSPICYCDSVTDNCEHFKEISRNGWSFSCRRIIQ